MFSDESMAHVDEVYEQMYQMFEEELDDWAEEYIRGLMMAQPLKWAVDSDEKNEEE